MGTDRFAAHGLQFVGVQTLLAEEESVTLWALQVRGTVAFVGLGVIVAAFLYTSTAMVGLIVGTGVVTQMIVAFQAMGTEITFSKKTLQTSEGVVILVFMQ